MQKAFQRITAFFCSWKRTPGFNCFCASESSNFSSINPERTRHAASIYWQALTIHFLKGYIRWEVNFKQSQCHFHIKTISNSWTVYLLHNAQAAQAGLPAKQVIKEGIRLITTCKEDRVICFSYLDFAVGQNGVRAQKEHFSAKKLCTTVWHSLPPASAPSHLMHFSPPLLFQLSITSMPALMSSAYG